MPSSLSRPVRVGVLGCGRVFVNHYGAVLDTLCSHGRVEVVAACDVDPSRRASAATRFARIRFSTDYREVVDADDVDLVLVLTPAQMHGTLAAAALESGKHVLVEKPLATTIDEAAELVTLANAGSGRLLCAPFVVLSPTFRIIWKRVVHMGDIGRVLLARARCVSPAPPWAQWFYQPGGGALFDLAVYNITTLTGLLGPALRVVAMAGVAVPDRELDGRHVVVEAVDNAHILLDFGGTVLASVATGFTVQEYRSPAIELYGSDGTIQMLGDDWAPEGYEVWHADEGAWRIYPESDPSWHWTDGLPHFVECIERGLELLVTPSHAFHVLEIMVKAEESARDGRARELTSKFAPLRFDANDIDVTPVLRRVARRYRP